MARGKRKAQYKIIITSHGLQIEFVNWYQTVKDAYKAFKRITTENAKNVVFPVKYINHMTIKEADYEILLLKRRERLESKAQKLRNEYGQFIDHIIDNDDDWIIVDKCTYNKEESFWVFGYHPKHQRKDFMFILTNFFIKEMKDKDLFKRILIYKNKLLIQYDNNIEIVICKCVSDCVRLYSEIESKCEILKIKNVCFSGYVSNVIRDKIESIIHEKTGWNQLKIRRSSTRP